MMRVRPEDRKMNTGISIDRKILAQLDKYRGGFSRSATIEGILAGFLEMITEDANQEAAMGTNI